MITSDESAAETGPQEDVKRPPAIDLEKQKKISYELNITRGKDERDRIQKKTFTKWCNQHLRKSGSTIDDLYEDLRDGFKLLSLLEILSGTPLAREKGKNRFHRL